MFPVFPQRSRKPILDLTDEPGCKKLQFVSYLTYSHKYINQYLNVLPSISNWLKIMKFSEAFEVTKTAEDDWFDPILNIDTKLFIDPFLIYSSETEYFAGSHDEIISFFNHIFLLVAESGGNLLSVPWKKAESLLRTREVSSLCLGYTKFGIKGSAAGIKLAENMTHAIYEVIKNGKYSIDHFEEIAMIREGIGADRISDMTATILKHRLIKYTQKVCINHKIPLVRKKFRQGYFNEDYLTWMPIDADLPLNSYSKNSILLVPKKFLRQLPTINLGDFWDYSFYNENETLRNDFSYDIQKKINKHEIVEFAKRHPEVRERYIHLAEISPPDPYDFSQDEKGFVRWYNASKNYIKDYPINLKIDSKSSFKDAIKTMINAFVNFVVNNRGWSLLWNDNGKPKSEDAAQYLFLGIVMHYCRANNIDISREANIGRGPVDFKVSSGFSLRALLELKLAKNTKFWRGLSRQLPKYMQSEEINLGYFVIILYNDKDFNKLNGLRENIEKVNQRTKYSIVSVAVDAQRDPLSASKL